MSLYQARPQSGIRKVLTVDTNYQARKQAKGRCIQPHFVNDNGGKHVRAKNEGKINVGSSISPYDNCYYDLYTVTVTLYNNTREILPVSLLPTLT